MKQFLKTTLAVLLSSLFFFLILFGVLIYNVEHNLSKNTIIETVDNIDIVTLMEQNAKTSQVLNQVYQAASSYGISEEMVNTFFHSNALKKAVREILNDTVENILDQKEVTISKEKWHTLLDQTMINIEEEWKLDLPERQKQAFLEEVKAKSDTILSELSEKTEQITTQFVTNRHLKTTKYLFQTSTKLLLWGSVLGISIFIFLLKRKEFAWLLYLGVPMVTLAILFLLMGIGVKVLFHVLISTEEVTSTMLSIATVGIQQSLLVSAVILLVLAILSFVLYFILDKKKKDDSQEAKSVIE